MNCLICSFSGNWCLFLHSYRSVHITIPHNKNQTFLTRHLRFSLQAPVPKKISKLAAFADMPAFPILPLSSVTHKKRKPILRGCTRPATQLSPTTLIWAVPEMAPSPGCQWAAGSFQKAPIPRASGYLLFAEDFIRRGGKGSLFAGRLG